MRICWLRAGCWARNTWPARPPWWTPGWAPATSFCSECGPNIEHKATRRLNCSSHSVEKKTGDVSIIYSADTVIQYGVAGKQYSTNLIHFGQTLGSGDASEAELQRLRYPVDAEVSVSYDPSQPWIGVWGFEDLRPWYDRVAEDGNPIGD